MAYVVVALQCAVHVSDVSVAKDVAVMAVKRPLYVEFGLIVFYT